MESPPLAHVLALDIAEIIESLSKGIDGRQLFEGQDTDGDCFPRRLLRARRERPRRRRTAEQRDEVATLQLIELHSMPASQTRIVRYRIGEAASGGMTLFHNPATHSESGPGHERPKGDVCA